MKAPVSFRLFKREDIPFGMELKRIAGWNQLPADWERFLTLEPKGCFVAELGDNSKESVGTVTTTTYELRFGWVGMVLVPPGQRRKGIGTALLMRAIEYLEQKGVESVRLDATPMGKQLYDSIDFHDEYHLERVQGCGQAMTFENVGPMRAEDISEVSVYDAPRFGAPRRLMLEQLYCQAPDLCFVARNQAGLSGYLMARPGEDAWQIGPWTADDPETGEQLLRTGLNALGERPVFMDILSGHPTTPETLKKYGFTSQRPFIRMYRGKLSHPGRPESMFAICGVETG